METIIAVEIRKQFRVKQVRVASTLENIPGTDCLAGRQASVELTRSTSLTSS